MFCVIVRDKSHYSIEGVKVAADFSLRIFGLAFHEVRFVTKETLKNSYIRLVTMQEVIIEHIAQNAMKPIQYSSGKKDKFESF